jgi:hypothetical protein
MSSMNYQGPRGLDGKQRVFQKSIPETQGTQNRLQSLIIEIFNILMLQ